MKSDTAMSASAAPSSHEETMRSTRSPSNAAARLDCSLRRDRGNASARRRGWPIRVDHLHAVGVRFVGEADLHGYHHLLDPARSGINPQGVVDGALVGLGARRLAHVQRATVGTTKGAGHPLLAAENAAQRVP